MPTDVGYCSRTEPHFLGLSEQIGNHLHFHAPAPIPPELGTIVRPAPSLFAVLLRKVYLRAAPAEQPLGHEVVDHLVDHFGALTPQAFDPEEPRDC